MMLWVLCLCAWQQRVDYTIAASLDTAAAVLIGTACITYHNNSPDSLDRLYFHLYANAFRDGETVYAREELRISGSRALSRAGAADRGGLAVRSVAVDATSVPAIADDSLLQVVLPSPLAPGAAQTLTIDFTLKVPRQFSRLGRSGNHYEFVQWYPKACVYDQRGWHRYGYHALGEFYGEFGTFTVTVDIPGSFVVAATGERIDPDDQTFVEALISTGAAPSPPPRRRAGFRAENVHDFAWACDPEFLIVCDTVTGVEISTFVRPQNRNRWRSVPDYACAALQGYQRWFGGYPYSSLSIVDSEFRGGMEYPQLVMIGPADDRLTRGLETVVIHEIAHQWFYGLLGSNEYDEAWLDEGFTTYAEIRYFEERYGPANSILRLPMLPALSRRTYHRVVHYVTHTNGLDAALLTPPYSHLDAPLGYVGNAYSKPALLLLAIEGIIGRPQFEAALQAYCQRFRYGHPTSEDVVALLHEYGGPHIADLLDRSLRSAAFCDWSVAAVRGSRVVVRNHGTLPLPVDVLVQGDGGGRILHLDGSSRQYEFDLPELGRIRHVTIDPSGTSIETDRWNNCYPRRVRIVPVFDWPSLDAYQIYVVPYVWYGTEDGITPGLYLAGARFLDAGMVKGGHQWYAGSYYGLRSHSWYPGFMYQTPVIFRRGIRVRFVTSGSFSTLEQRLATGFNADIGIPLTPRPRYTIGINATHWNLAGLDKVDAQDWEIGTCSALGLRAGASDAEHSASLEVEGAHSRCGSDWDYLKISGEVSAAVDLVLPCRIRVFAGAIAGTAPRQEHFYLNGSLRITTLADLFFSQKGDLSPMEHLHVDGNGDLVGYQTLHIATDRIATANLELPSRFPVRLFCGAGAYGAADGWTPAWEVGVRAVLGPLSLHVPLLVKDADRAWLRWSIEL